MLTAVLRITILMAATLAGCLQAGMLDNVRALETGKTGWNVSTMNPLSLPENGAVATIDRNVQNTPPVWYLLNDNRRMRVQDWEVALFMQPTYPYCRQFVPMLEASSQKTGSDISPISLDRKGDAEFSDVLPTTPGVMVECFQGGLSMATPATFLTNVNTMEIWPPLQGVIEAGEFRSRLNEVLRMALDRQSERSIPLNAQGQQ